MKTASRIILGIISAVIIVLALVIVPQFFGVGMKEVVSGSMEPDIPKGSMVVVIPADISDLEVGDDVTYKLKSGKYVTHRIIAMDTSESYIQTKGINSRLVDPPVYADSITGKVLFSVPILGTALGLLSTLKGKIIFSIIIVALFVISVLLDYGAKKEEAASGSKDNTVDLQEEVPAVNSLQKTL